MRLCVAPPSETSMKTPTKTPGLKTMADARSCKMPRMSLKKGYGTLTATFILFFMTASGTLPTVSALRNVRINVPEAVRRGDAARLFCDYDLETSPLYSIKWYRGDEEFYRYVPKEAPPTQVFALPGISVDVSQSDAKEVHLRDVQMSLSGVFKCEVSADAPFFHTDIKAAPMVVVDFADELPTLSIDKLKYGPGERIRANCSSPASYPAANITWFLNGRKVPLSAVYSYPITTVEKKEEPEEEREEPQPPKKKKKPRPVEPSLERALVGLDLDPEAISEHFNPRDGGHSRTLTLRCLSTLFGIFRRATETQLTAEDSPKIASVVLGSSRKEASIGASSSASRHPPLGCHYIHHSGTPCIRFMRDLNGAALTTLANILIAVNAVGWR